MRCTWHCYSHCTCVDRYSSVYSWYKNKHCLGIRSWRVPQRHVELAISDNEWARWSHLLIIPIHFLKVESYAYGSIGMCSPNMSHRNCKGWGQLLILQVLFWKDPNANHTASSVDLTLNTQHMWNFRVRSLDTLNSAFSSRCNADTISLAVSRKRYHCNQHFLEAPANFSSTVSTRESMKS